MHKAIREIDRFGRAVRVLRQDIVCVRRACIEDETAAAWAYSSREHRVLSILRISLITVRTESPCALHLISTPRGAIVRQNIMV